MDSGFRTPLLDFFRRGEVARDIRLSAAQGAMAPRAHEQIGLLMLLVADTDPEVAAAAETTLRAIPEGSLRPFLARSDVPAEVREFFAQRGIEVAASAAPSADDPLVDNSGVDELAALEAEPAPPEGKERASVVQKIASLNVAGRMSLAMKGSREERQILIRDPNKIVGVSVLSSPKMTESEIEAIAKMASVSEEILRMIGFSRAWTKNYSVVHALVKNPKTPVALAMNLMSRLNEKDLRMLSGNRNVSDILRVTARKKIVFDK
jgi:hypothetical protein